MSLTMPTLQPLDRPPASATAAAATAAAAPDEMMAFLANPALYAHGPARVDIVQTHISYVCLGDDMPDVRDWRWPA